MQADISPAPGTNRDQQIRTTIQEREPVVSEQILLNGLNFVSAVQPVSAQATVKIVYDSGAKIETAGEFGLMHFYEHLPPAAFRERNNGLSLRRYCKQRGWEPHISTSEEEVEFGFSLPPFETQEGLAALSEMLGYAAHDFEGIFPVEKGRILNEEAQARFDVRFVIPHLIKKALYEGTGYAHPVIGYAADIEGYSLSDVNNLGLSLLTSDRATFIAIGDEDTVSKAYQYATSLPATICPRTDFPPLKPALSIRELPQYMYAATPLVNDIHIYAVIDAPKWSPSDEIVALQSAISVLSDHFVDSLSDSLGITYASEAYHNVVGPNGRIELWSNVSSEHISQTLDTMRECVGGLTNNLTKQDIDDYYLSCRNQIYQASLENPAGHIASFLTEGNFEYRARSALLQQILGLDVDTVRRVAGLYMQPENLRFLFIGDASEIAKLQTSQSNFQL